MAKFTKGPWEWASDSCADYLIPSWLSDDDKEYPCLEAIIDDGSGCGEYRQTISKDSPDAHLIASAPELYEALDWLVQVFDGEYPLHADKIVKAKNALAKARGE